MGFYEPLKGILYRICFRVEFRVSGVEFSLGCRGPWGVFGPCLRGIHKA